MEQKDKQFIPHVLAIQSGTDVVFPNFDPIYHNVFSLSPSRRFDLGKYPRGSSRTVNFPKPGLVNVYCDIHSNMEAFILVLPHHGFTRPRASGEFRLPDLGEGLEEGDSLVEQEKIPLAKKTLEEIGRRHLRVILPVDCVIADRMDNEANRRVVPVSKIPAGWRGLDIGPETVKLINIEVRRARTIVWNGPMGVFEMPPRASTARARTCHGESGANPKTMRINSRVWGFSCGCSPGKYGIASEHEWAERAEAAGI